MQVAALNQTKTLPDAEGLADLVLMLNFSAARSGPQIKRIVAMSALLVKVCPSPQD